jgi:Tape measure protein
MSMGFKIQGEFNLKGNASNELKNVGAALRSVKNDGNQVGGVLGRTGNAMRNAGSSASRAGQDARGGARGFTMFGQAAQHAGNLAQGAAKRAGDAWRTSANTIKGAGNGLRAGLTGVFNLPNALLAGGVGLVGKGIIDAVGYKEQRLVGLKTLFGNATLAAKAYAFAESEASKSPFETTSVLESVQGLKAWGFTAGQIPNTFRAIANAASGLSLGDAGLTDLTTVFGQIKGSLKLSLDDTKQLQERGFDAFGALAQGYKVSKGAIGAMISKGQIRGEDAANILLEFAAKKYKGSSDAQGKTIFGLASTLKSRPFELFSSLDVNKELKPFKSVLENLTTLTDFKNNPTGKKIAARFQQSMGLVFKGAFGGLAKFSKPEEVGKMLDKVFDKLDQATSWLAKNGPSIVSGFKSFFTGIGDTINTVRGGIEWAVGAFGKLRPALEGLGLMQDPNASPGSSRSGKMTSPGGSSKGMFTDLLAGKDFARIAGTLVSGIFAGSALNGVLGGVPGDLLKGAGDALKSVGEKAFGSIQDKIAEKFGFGGSDVQKVFVTNIGGGLGDVLGNGPGGGSPRGPGGPRPGPGGARGGFLSRVGNLLSTDLTPIVRNGLGRFRAGLTRTWQALNPANIGAALRNASRGIGATIMRGAGNFSGRFSQSMNRFFPTFGALFRRGASAAGNVLGRLPAMRAAMSGMVTRIGQSGSLFASRIGQGLASTGRRASSSMIGFATRFGTGMIGLTRTLGASLLTFGARFGASVIGFTTTLGSSLVGLGTRLGASMIGFAGTFSGGLAALSGTILGKLGLAAAAFGAGWAIGTQINKIETGGLDDKGKPRTVGYDVQEGFRYAFMGGAKADQDAMDADNRMFEAQMKRKRQQRESLKNAGRTNGKAYGTGLTNGMNSSAGGVNKAGQGMGNAAAGGTRKALDVRSPSRVAHSIGQLYGVGLEGGVLAHLKPVQRAAQVLAAAVAITPSMGGFGPSGGPAGAAETGRPGVVLTAPVRASLPAMGSMPKIEVTVNFGAGSIVVGGSGSGAGVNSGDLARVGSTVREQSRAGVEQGLLEAFERLAAQIAGS